MRFLGTALADRVLDARMIRLAPSDELPCL